MAKFKCTQKVCKNQHKIDDVDIRLRLTIRDSHYTTYHMNEDGTLEYYDGDGEGQEYIIKCPICGTEYEFQYHLGYIGEQHVLPMKNENVEVIRKRP